MDKLQEIKERISKLKGYENAKPTDQYWMAKEHIDFLIDRTELSVKQQEIIEENKRQQDVTVNQFRQTREEIQRLKCENGNFRRLLATFTDEEDDPFGMNDTYMVYDTQSEDVEFHGTMKSAKKDFECAMDGLDNGETAYILKVIKVFTPKGEAE